MYVTRQNIYARTDKLNNVFMFINIYQHEERENSGENKFKNCCSKEFKRNLLNLVYFFDVCLLIMRKSREKFNNGKKIFVL